MIKTELKAKLQKGSFIFKERGNTIPKAQIVNIEAITPTLLNHSPDEYDNCTFEGRGRITLEEVEQYKYFSGSAKVVDGKDGKLVIEITKPIIIR